MSPVDLTRAQREELQREIDRNRRWELRLPVYGGIALVVIAAVVVVRVVFFS
ncbi:hypothetical protein [uncultured Leifsonia sp.]|jgi:hypothetical protein|uniref:hypothetical protein n=1 Tax=uncultured Leifsonia sp. TaxID=340359 RepID=UPI0025F62F55|nr:hypothetical protein [uncultured Leifsonia sp.]